jgi:hypothetical protein
VTGQATASAKIAVCGVALLAVSLAVHGLDLWTPGLVDRSGRLKGSDYSRLYITGSIAAEGRWDSLFDPAVHGSIGRSRVHPQLEMEGLHPNYGPTAAWLLAPFSRLPFLQSWLVFSAVSVLAYLLAVAALAQTFPSLRSRKWLVVVFAAASPGLFAALRFGQLSAITTALFAIAVALDRRRHPWLAGIAVGLAGYKPNLILPAAAIWFFSGNWRRLAGLGAGAAIQVGIGVLVAGIEPTHQWVDVLRTLASNPNLVQGFPAEVHSLRGFWRLLGADGTALMTITAVSCLAVLAAAVRLWRRPRLDRGWATLVLVTILVSPHLLTYDLLLLVVPLIIVADDALAREGRIRLAAPSTMLALLLYAAPPASSLIAKASAVQFSTVVMVALLWRLVRTDAIAAAGSPVASSPIMNS